LAIHRAGRFGKRQGTAFSRAVDGVDTNRLQPLKAAFRSCQVDSPAAEELSFDFFCNAFLAPLTRNNRPEVQFFPSKFFRFSAFFSCVRAQTLYSSKRALAL
jgi:hypothetical protein